MQLKHKCLLLFLGAILLQECQKRELDVALPYDGDKLVIFSELNPDKSVRLYLNQTYPPTGKFTVKQGLAGAEVDLLENGIFKERLTYSDSGLYVSKIGFKPIIGNFYSFEVKLNNYPNTSTQPVEIPQSVVKVKVVFGKDTVPSTFTGENARKLEVEWDDVESRRNYYVVGIDGEYKNQFLLVNTFVIGKDGEIEDGCSFRRNRNRFVFQDICFPLQQVKANFGIAPNGFLQGLNNAFGDARRNADAYKVSISNVSESYFRWLQDELQPEDIFLAFQLPKSRFSNVNNGYGIVVASNTTTFYLSAK
jgi:hypothetical protein